MGDRITPARDPLDRQRLAEADAHVSAPAHRRLWGLQHILFELVQGLRGPFRGLAA